MNYKGSCHCGQISYEVEGELDQVMECNCSICSHKGYLLWFVPRKQLHLSTPESGLATYTFNQHKIKHRFCPNCSCSPFGEGAHPTTRKSMAAINVRCLEDVVLSSLTRVPIDGRSL